MHISHGASPVILILTVLAGFQPDSALAEREPAIIIGGSAWVADAPTKVADHLGLFNLGPAAKPQIETVNLPSGQHALNALFRGEVDFALVATTPLALALAGLLDVTGEQIVDLAVLASIALSSQTHLMLTNRDHGIEMPADLRGKRIGVMHGSSAHFGWSRFAIFHQLVPDEVTLIDLPTDRLGPALLDGEIDAAVTWEPWADVVRLHPGFNAVEFDLRMLYTVNWLLVTRKSLLAGHPGVAERVLNGYLQAVRYLRTDREHAIGMYAQAIDRPLDRIRPLADGIIWRVTMDWSILANMESHMEWLRQKAGGAALRHPEPSEYLVPDPLAEVAYSHIRLPRYLLQWNDPGPGQLLP